MVVVKGAPEYIMPMCTSVLNGQGRVVDLNNVRKEEILKQEIEGKMCKRGLRALAYAFKIMHIDDWNNAKETHNYFIEEKDRYSLEQ